MTGWIVAYDISCPKRWRRVYARVSQIGYRLQYSLYWVPGSERTGHALARDLAGIIDPRQDDVRLYPLPGDAWARFYGVPPWTEGVDDPLYRRFGHCWRARAEED